MSDTARFINRELSWLEFNQRVLEEAADPAVPLLERVNFLAIAAANLDEFFMVRIGGLKLMREAGITTPDPAGMRPAEQLAAVQQRTGRMITDIATLYRTGIAPAMAAEAGLRAVTAGTLTAAQLQTLGTLFRNQLFPALTPTAIHSGHPFPLLNNLTPYLLVKLAPAPRRRTPRFAFIPIPPSLPRFVPLPDTNARQTFILIEDVIATFAGTLFPGQEILECAPVRATRNADVHVDETYAADLAHAMRTVLRRRKTSGCVRLETAAGTSAEMIDWLKSQLTIEEIDVVRIDAPLQIQDLRVFYNHEGLDHLRYPAWPPQQNPQLDPARRMFDIITSRDVIHSLPYERFDPVIRLIEEAADDPDVLAIKQVLYRTSSDSPIIEALRRAARRGKAVTVLIELKARFDEANNMEWAARLERNGVQVVYGIKDLKTHAKICMIVRREAEGIVRYLHFGTGNYNPKTATLYTDVGLFTRQDDLGVDASAFFNAVCGFSEPQPQRKMAQAPIDLRERLLDLINAETMQREQGHKAGIMAKMNALVDPEIIEALYRASCAGVRIDLIVRGVCCLRPGVPGMSENIRVISIVDRFLEHSRIFSFYHGGARQVFISSADWMPRNLSRRIELMIPVEDRKCRDRLIEILNTCLADSCKGRQMQPDGTYTRHEHPSAASRAQEKQHQAACRDVLALRQAKRTKFEPHLPPASNS
jgi:polyphosphate kinase